MRNILQSFMSLILGSICVLCVLYVLYIYLLIHMLRLDFDGPLIYSGRRGRRFWSLHVMRNILMSFMSPALGSIALSSIYMVIQASMVRSYSPSSSVLPRPCHGPATVLSCELVARISVLFTSAKRVSEAARCEGLDRLSITGIILSFQIQIP